MLSQMLIDHETGILNETRPVPLRNPGPCPPRVAVEFNRVHTFADRFFAPRVVPGPIAGSAMADVTIVRILRIRGILTKSLEVWSSN